MLLSDVRDGPDWTWKHDRDGTEGGFFLAFAPGRLWRPPCTRVRRKGGDG
jgi:hypothetical protein